MPIGELLLQRAIVTEGQLEDALQNQKFFPAKTGTQLLELGFLRLEALERVLSEQHGFPCAEDEALSELDAFCRNQFPVEAIERFLVMPFRYYKGTLSVAMVNPGDSVARQWLQSFSSAPLEVFCISEVRFFYYLFRNFRRDAKPKVRALAYAYFKERCRKSLSGAKPPALNEHRVLASQISHELSALGLAPLAHGETLADPNMAPWELQSVPGLHVPVASAHSDYEPEFADLSDLK